MSDLGFSNYFAFSLTRLRCLSWVFVKSLLPCQGQYINMHRYEQIFGDNVILCNGVETVDFCYRCIFKFDLYSNAEPVTFNIAALLSHARSSSSVVVIKLFAFCSMRVRVSNSDLAATISDITYLQLPSRDMTEIMLNLLQTNFPMFWKSLISVSGDIIKHVQFTLQNIIHVLWEKYKRWHTYGPKRLTCIKNRSFPLLLATKSCIRACRFVDGALI